MTLYRHVVKGTIPGDSWSCTMHTSGSLGLTAAQSAWQTAWTELWNGLAPPADNINQLCSTFLSCTQVSTAALDPVSLRETANTATTIALPGTAASDALPAQCSLCVSWTSSTPGRSGRGRMYLPQFTAGFLSAAGTGLITTACQTIVKTAATNLLASLNSSGLTPSLVSRTTKVVTPITGGSVDNIIDTQRRRRDKIIGSRMTFV